MSGAFDPRITAYFGDAVMQAGFMPLPHLFLRHYRQLGLSHVQAMFALQLMEIAWDVGRPPSSVSKLADRMGVGHRTIQICTKELHALGLIDVYDQFDDGGAQVENGYDLSPLFHRLAEFAPSERPAGELRERRPRARPGQDAQETAAPPAESYTTPVQESAPAPRSLDHRPAAGLCAPPVIEAAGLKTETKKQIKKQTKNKEHAAAVVLGQWNTGNMLVTAPEQPGLSLRWKIPLNTDEVNASQNILRQIGLNAVVVNACAPTMHPGECWALWCYARGVNLGVGWMASQMYDFRKRRAQPTAVAQAYDHVGKQLADLPLNEAQALLDTIDQSHQLNPMGQARLWEEQPSGLEPHAELLVALHDIRSGRHTHRALATGTYTDRETSDVLTGKHATETVSDATTDPVWSHVRSRLEKQVDHEEFVTWLAPLALLEVADGRAYIGAPNVFVRDSVAERYRDRIAYAWREVAMKTVEVVMVIGS